MPDGSRQQHRQLGASQTKEGQGEEEVGGGDEGRDMGGNHPRKVFPSHNPKITVGVGEGVWGNMRLTTASGPGLTTDFLKRPQNCEIGLSLRTPRFTCPLHHSLQLQGQYDYPHLTRRKTEAQRKLGLSPMNRGCAGMVLYYLQLFSFSQTSKLRFLERLQIMSKATLQITNNIRSNC